MTMFAFDDDFDPLSSGSSLSLSDSAEGFSLSESTPPREPFPVHKLAVNQTTTIRWSVNEDLEGYREAGFQAIGVSLAKLRRDGLRESVQKIRMSRMPVSSLGWIGGFTGDHGHSLDDAIVEGRKAIKLAQGIGAASLVVVSGTTGKHISSYARKLLKWALKELLEPARKAGVQLALLPMHQLFDREWSFLHKLDETIEILEQLNHPHLGMAFNPYHLWQEPDLVSRIASFSQHLNLVQVADFRNPPRGDNDRLLPGAGCIPLHEILQAVRETDYRGWYELEVWSRELWQSDYRDALKTCREWFAEIGN